ncbi:hypothetical protein [uncultured Nitrosomonas sp.]|uniref:hypothetical protein n=1 Tax=uncultured Nitrosomonas sp. TaxID=156424 RepID=UPI0025F5C067|nr:hypothetical protein [uncultured Nitrosomonas sp.]
MNKKTFTMEVETQMKQAYADGFRYLVTVYKKCPIGDKGTFVSYHYRITDASQTINDSQFRDFLVFQDLSLLIKKPEYFFIT